MIVLTHSRPTSPVNAPKLNKPVSVSPSLSVLGPPSRASLQPHLLPQSSCYFVAPNLLLLVHLSPGPRTPSALHTAGATPGQPAVVDVPRSIEWPSKPLEARGWLSRRRSTHEARTGGTAGRQEPEAVNSSPEGRPLSEGRDVTESTARAVRSSQRARPRREGGVLAIRTPRSASGPRGPSLARRPREPALHTRLGPAQTLTRPRSGGNSSHSGTVSSSQRRFRARHCRPRSRAPEVPPLARLLCAPHWSLDLLNHRRRWRLVEAPWRVRPARS